MWQLDDTGETFKGRDSEICTLEVFAQHISVSGSVALNTVGFLLVWVWWPLQFLFRPQDQCFWLPLLYLTSVLLPSSFLVCLHGTITYCALQKGENTCFDSYDNWLNVICLEERMCSAESEISLRCSFYHGLLCCVCVCVCACVWECVVNERTWGGPYTTQGHSTRCVSLSGDVCLSLLLRQWGYMSNHTRVWSRGYVCTWGSAADA